MKSYVINLIRHGLTLENVEGRYTGSTDVSLSEEGRKKLETMHSMYTYPGSDMYFSSPLTRCKDTLKILYPEQEFNVLDGLRECNFGDWEGKTISELSSDEYFKKWLEHQGEISPPNGESSIIFASRVFSEFENLVESMMRLGKTSSTVVTHGGVMMMILERYGIPKAKAYNWLVENGCGYSVRITPGLWMRDKVFEIFRKLPIGYETSDYVPAENFKRYFSIGDNSR